MPKPNGAVLWEGPSELDGSPVVVIATGLRRPSENAKTGPMIQVWILARDHHPVKANREGLDGGICGDCPLRGGKDKPRACYVTLSNAVAAVWRTYKAGNYTHEWGSLPPGIPVRVGAYGDPAAVPTDVWERLLKGRQWTAYTHQWRGSHGLKGFAMASVDSDIEYWSAVKKGWRTYRARPKGSPLLPGEIECPNTTKGVRCSECKLCSGGAGGARNISVEAHGVGGKYIG